MKLDLSRAEEFKSLKFQEMKQYMERYISDDNLREFTEKCLECAPLYFWIIPKSPFAENQSGKNFEEGEGGLVNHTIFAMYLGYTLGKTFGLDDREKSLAVSTLALHDTIKFGFDFDERYYQAHPYLPRILYGKGRGGRHLDRYVSESDFNIIMGAVEKHMGSLSSGEYKGEKYWKTIAGVPESKIEQVVHLADNISGMYSVYFSDFIKKK